MNKYLNVYSYFYNMSDLNKITVMFTDMWFKDIYNNRFINKLKDYFKLNIEIDTEKPDFVIYSICGNSFLKYPNSKKIFICWEPINFKSSIHLNNCDYSLTYYSSLEDNKKHLYFPPIWETFGFVDNFINDINNPIIVPKKKFCCFVVKNTNFGIGATLRISFFKELSKYKKVDSFGESLRNCDIIIPGRNEGFGRKFFDIVGEYKFMITFENINSPGVVTEKIYNAFISNTIPIYWGNKDINKIFNTESFINCHDFETIPKVIDYIKEVDNDDELYYKILNSRKIQNTEKEFYIKKYKDAWEKILYST